jgi:hypothetical protein
MDYARRYEYGELVGWADHALAKADKSGLAVHQMVMRWPDWIASDCPAFVYGMDGRKVIITYDGWVDGIAIRYRQQRQHQPSKGVEQAEKDE